MSIFQDWRAGVPYDEMHRKYGPWSKCECDDCDAKRKRHTHEGSCDAPNCDHMGEVLPCYDCGGEFCFDHAEQEHHNCQALSDETAR